MNLLLAYRKDCYSAIETFMLMDYSTNALMFKPNGLTLRFRDNTVQYFFYSELIMPDELVDEIDELKVEAKSKSNWLAMFEVLMLLYNGAALKQPKVRDTDSSIKYLMRTDFCIPSSCTFEDFRSSVAQLIGSRVIGNTSTPPLMGYFITLPL